MRQAMGTAVFSGMIGVTLFGLFLTPVFYVTLMKLGVKPKPAPEAQGGLPGAAGAATVALILAVVLIPSSAAHANWLEVGPDYHSPTNALPPAYKAADYRAWIVGQPLDNLPKGAWWEAFGDTNLNALEAQAVQANQQLQAAIARVTQARDVARVSFGDLLPNVIAAPSYNRQRYSPTANPSFGPLTANTFSTPLDLSYEVDLWGRVRRSFESARADAQASLADFYNVLLTLNADLAENYFSLRSVDAEIAAVADTVALRREQVRLVRGRFDGGIGSELEVAQAETELATTEADVAALAQQRDQLENAIAVLTGQNPATFQLSGQTPANWNPSSPQIPAGLPADLLQRRPDVAAAERQLASANAKIGVSKAAFFPAVTLTGSAGYLSGSASTLFDWESRTWSFGPGVSFPIFAGGVNRANLLHSRAVYAEALANYRQQVLIAFSDVENSLSGIRHLADQSAAQTRAVKDAEQATSLATERYRSGIVAYIEVVDASRDALTSERANAQLSGQRLIAAVQLIKALGGGWDEGQLFASAANTGEPAGLPPGRPVKSHK
jgi:multidrug efflux system outer membrane protein